MENDKNKSDLKYQVDNYDSLGVTQSRRGQAVLFFGVVLLFSFLFAPYLMIETADLVFSLIIYLPVLFYIYKGHRWAIITLMAVWVIEKIYIGYIAMELGFGFMGSIIWLIIGVWVLYRALEVENERMELEESQKKEDNNGRDCVKCGRGLSSTAKFCGSCGTEVNKN